MKVNTQLRDVKISDELESEDFSIENDVFMFNLLSDKLYARKEEAVIREYTCNMIDAHNMVGQIKPWWISMPNAIEPMLTFRDFGPGMSHEDVMRRFSRFGSSSKKDSATDVGGFGIGCKVGFAYADAFTGCSYQAGEKRSYAFFRTAQGKPRVTCVSTEPTDEPDGFEIRVPVREVDFRKFADITKRVLQHYPVGSFIAHGVEVKPTEYTAKNDAFWTRASAADKPHVLMGPVAYEVDWSQVLGVADEEGTMVIPDHLSPPPLTITPVFPIGGLEIMPNREALAYDRNTKMKLRAFYDTFVARFATDFYDNIKDETPWTQMRAVHNARNNGTWKYISAHFKAGLPGIAEHFIVPGQPHVMKVEGTTARRSYTKNYKVGGSYRVESEKFIKLTYAQLTDAKTDVVLVFDDMDDVPDHKRRVQARFKNWAQNELKSSGDFHLFDMKDERTNPIPTIIGPRHPNDPVYKIQPVYNRMITGGYTSVDELRDTIASCPAAESITVKLSEMPLPAPAGKTARQAKGPVKVRVLTVEGGEAGRSSYSYRRRGGGSSWWNDEGKEADTGVYVPMKAYDIDPPKGLLVADIVKMINSSWLAGRTVYGLSKKAQAEANLGDGGFERIDLYLARVTAEAMKNPAVVAELDREAIMQALQDNKDVSDVFRVLSYRSDRGAALFPKMVETIQSVMAEGTTENKLLAARVRNYYQITGKAMPKRKLVGKDKVLKEILKTLQFSPLLREAVFMKQQYDRPNYLSAVTQAREVDLVTLSKVRSKKEQDVVE